MILNHTILDKPGSASCFLDSQMPSFLS